MLYIDLGGERIPRLGYGTWRLEGEDCTRGVRTALDLGYRLIDTAQLYGNEEQVGQAIAESGVPRRDIFLTTKVWITRLAAGSMRASVRESLEKLRVGQVDLLLLHWPVEADASVEEALATLDALRQEGKTRHIGVSNYTTAHLRRAFQAGVPIITDQVEYHPLLSQEAVLSVLRERGMFLTAYSPVARGKLFDDPVVRRIAERHGRHPAQVLLRWHMQQEAVVAIPKATSEAHIRANLGIFDFSLDEAEVAALSGLARPDGRLIRPRWAPDWD